MHRSRLLLLVTLVIATLLACKRSRSDGAAAGSAATVATSGGAPAAAHGSGPAALALQDASGASVASVADTKASYREVDCTVAGGGQLSLDCGSTHVKVKARDDGGIKLAVDGGAEIKLKLKEGGWKVEDGSDRELARIKRKDPGYVLEVDANRVASVAISGAAVEVRDARGATLYKGSGFVHHPELAIALALPESQLAPAQRAAMLAWVSR